MKRRALSDSALADDWSFDRGALVSNMVSQTGQNANMIPQQDMTLHYANTDQLERQSDNIGVLSAKVSELSQAQQHSNETANQLVRKIASAMEVIDRSTQKLSVESQRQAEKAQHHDDSLQYVRGLQEQWWNQNEVWADGQYQQHAELWNQHQRLQSINQRQEGINANVLTEPASASDHQERRRSVPYISTADETMPPPRRVTMPEYSMGMPSTVVYSQISDPPIFDESRYEDWKKAIQWWQEINAGTDGGRLLATIGMRAKGSIKIVLQEYFEQTKLNKQSRTIDSFVSLMGDKFRRPTEELILLRVEQWNEMKRKTPEGFKSYWIRLERLQRKLTDLGIVWPVKVAFRKAFSSLCMTEEQQALTRAALEMTTESDSLRELKRITAKLFDNQSHEIEDVCVAAESSDIDEADEDAMEWELRADRTKVSKNRG